MALSRRGFIGLTIGAGGVLVAAACGQAPSAAPTQSPAPAAAAPAAAPAATVAPQAAPTSTTAPAAAPTTAPTVAPTAAPTVAAQPAAPTGQSVELKMAGWYGKDNQRVAQTQIDLFTKKFPNVKVSIVVMEFAVEKNVVMMASGAAPDVFWVNNDHAAPWASRNAVRALDDFAKTDNVDFNDLYPIGKLIWTYKDKLYGFPDALAPIHIFYNPKLFEAAGVPPPAQTYGDPSWTTDAAVEKAKALTKRPSSGPADQYGIFIGTSIYSWLPLQFCFGGQIVDDDLNPTKVVFDSQANRDVIQWVADLRLKHKVNSNVGETQGMPDTAQFSNGKLAMNLTGPWMWPTWMDPAVRAKVPWEIAPVPKGPAAQTTDMAGNAYGMSTQTKNPDMAWQLLKFNTLGDGQLINWDPLTSNGMPGLKSLAQSPKWGSWFSPKSRQVIVDSIDHSHYKPKTPNWSEMVTVLDSSLSQVWTGTSQVAPSVQTAQAKITEAFQRKT